MTTGPDNPAAPADTPTGASGPVAEPGEIESMVAQARARARAAVVEELVAELIPAYRRAVGALAAPPNHCQDHSQDHSQDHPRDAGRVDDAPAIAWYVYAVARHDDLVGLVADDLVGVEGGPVTLVDSGDLTGIAAAVLLDPFQALGDEPDLTENGWLAGAVRAHESVVEAAFAHATVLPFRFGALYRSPDDVAAALSEQHASLTGELSRLDGAAEWGVRAYLNGYSGAGRPNDGPQSPEATGIEWMLHRRDAATARQAARQARELAAQDVHEVLSRHARECAVRPRPRGDAGGVPVLEGAYLFGRGDEARLRADAGALARRHADRGLRFQVTGPWPPYHFVRLSERISHG